eukprot:6981111-Pyramimonas_sp.AAC.1
MGTVPDDPGGDRQFTGVSEGAGPKDPKSRKAVGRFVEAASYRLPCKGPAGPTGLPDGKIHLLRQMEPSVAPGAGPVSDGR